VEIFSDFNCPYCGEALQIPIDLTGGSKQFFISDCEVCCKPIHIHLSLQGSEIVSFEAEQEDD
jgi:hypothetical protein